MNRIFTEHQDHAIRDYYKDVQRLVFSVNSWVRHERVVFSALLVGFLWMLAFLLAVVIFPVHLATEIPVPRIWDLTHIFDVSSKILVPFVGALFYFNATKLWRGHPGVVSWFFMGLCGIIIAADNAATLYEYLTRYAPGFVPSSSISSYIGLAAFPSFLVALLAIPTAKKEVSALQRLKLVMDTILFMAIISTVCFYFVLMPLYQNVIQTSGRVDLISFIFTILCMCFIYLIAIVTARSPQSGIYRAPLIAILIGTFIAIFGFIGDVVYYNLNSSLDVRVAADVLIMLAYLILSLGGWIAMKRAHLLKEGEKIPASQFQFDIPESIHNQIRFMREWTLTVIAAVTGIFILIDSTLVHKDQRGAIALLCVLLVLIVLRQAVALGENQKLLAVERQNIVQMLALHQEREQLIQQEERTRANEQALLKNNQRMDEFLNIASHELRTPLSAAKAHVQLSVRRLQKYFGEQSKSEPKVLALMEPLTLADQQASKLARLINDLLDVSRIQTGQMVLHFTETCLADLVKNTLADIRAIHPQREIPLDESVQTPAMVNADPDRIEQVLINYLNNAMKYSPEDSPIEVKMEQNGDYLRVSVSDHGMGLSGEQQSYIWDRFYRIHAAEESQEDSLQSAGAGLGLGLYICKGIIERHGGLVGVESVPGEGSTFWFSLPVASGSPLPSLPTPVAPPHSSAHPQ